MPSSPFTDAITQGHFVPPLRPDSSMADIGINKLAASRLEQSGIVMLCQLSPCSREDLIAVRGIEPVLVSEIQAALDVRGLKLRTENPSVES